MPVFLVQVFPFTRPTIAGRSVLFRSHHGTRACMLLARYLLGGLDISRFSHWFSEVLLLRFSTLQVFAAGSKAHIRKKAALRMEADVPTHSLARSRCTLTQRLEVWPRIWALRPF